MLPAFDVSTTDLDALVQLCKEQKIDGVFTNWIDSMLPGDVNYATEWVSLIHFH